jgi:hypothetical protein
MADQLLKVAQEVRQYLLLFLLTTDLFIKLKRTLPLLLINVINLQIFIVIFLQIWLTFRNLENFDLILDAVHRPRLKITPIHNNVSEENLNLITGIHKSWAPDRQGY